MYLPFALILHGIGQNLSAKTVVCALVPVISSLSLKVPQLLNFLLEVCIKTNNNNPSITVQDPDKVGLEHSLRLFKVTNF